MQVLESLQKRGLDNLFHVLVATRNAKSNSVELAVVFSYQFFEGRHITSPASVDQWLVWVHYIYRKCFRTFSNRRTHVPSFTLSGCWAFKHFENLELVCTTNLV